MQLTSAGIKNDTLKNERYAASPSFPTLRTKYVATHLEVVVSGLPAEAFETIDTYRGDAPVRRGWRWIAELSQD